MDNRLYEVMKGGRKTCEIISGVQARDNDDLDQSGRARGDVV